LSNDSPGTVSKILWHFTGGPIWDAKANKQGKKLKPAKDAFSNLKAIIRSRTLKIGRFKEVVNVVLPSYKQYSPREKKVIEIKNKPITMHSSSVCCLADIPAVHLGYHATRYGKFAIGFHRSSVVKHGFNPVLYTLPTTEVIRHIYEGLSSVESIDAASVVEAAESIETNIMNEIDEYEYSDISVDTSDVVSEAEVMEGYAQEAQSSIQDFIAFIKTFEENQFDSIYCEREWRSVQDFKFTFDDVAMIVAPKQLSGENYFQALIENVKQLKIPRRIPIMPWEDLVEN
jgi:hypothetical protein